MRPAPDSRAVAAELALWANISIDEAQEVYESELSKLERGATLTSFLPMLAKRSARERLWKERSAPSS